MKSSKRSIRFSSIMKQSWFKGLCLSVLVILVVLFFIELTDRFAFRPKSIFAKTVKDFEKNKDEIQILFCGQSDVMNAIIPEMISDDTFNFAGHGESYIETYYKLKHYIQDMPELKLVVIPVTLNSFSSTRLEEINYEYFAYGYITYSDLLELYRLRGIAVIKEKLISFCPNLRGIRMSDFLHNMKRLLTGQPIGQTEINKGYLKNEGSFLDDKNNQKRVKRYLGRGKVFEDDVLLYFDKILTLCQTHNVKIITITLPLTDDYVSLSKEYVTKAQLYEKVLDNPRYSKYIDKHLDFLTDVYSKDHSLFYNQDHLNHKGAVMVSSQVAAELSEIYPKEITNEDM